MTNLFRQTVNKSSVLTGCLACTEIRSQFIVVFSIDHSLAIFLGYGWITGNMWSHLSSKPPTILKKDERWNKKKTNKNNNNTAVQIWASGFDTLWQCPYMRMFVEHTHIWKSSEVKRRRRRVGEFLYCILLYGMCSQNRRKGEKINTVRGNRNGEQGNYEQKSIMRTHATVKTSNLTSCDQFDV